MVVPLPAPHISIAGSMMPSARAAADARDITSCLAADGAVLVGGLERGIDAASHKTVIACGGMTVVVLETPLDTAHPAANTALWQKIMRRHLAVSLRAAWDDVAHGGPTVRNGIVAMLSHGFCEVTVIRQVGQPHAGAASYKNILFLYALIVIL